MRAPLALALVVTLWSAPQFLVAQALAPSAAVLPWLAGDEAVEYMRSAPIAKMEQVPVGVTKPLRAYFKGDGPVRSVIIKKLRPGRTGGFWESYQSEIAAYEFDRLLDLRMVPPTVEKRVDGDMASAQLWVDNCVWLKELKGRQPPDIASWNRQVYRQRVFDNLIANIDRNEGNLLVYRTPAPDSDWHLVLVDHSRAFTGSQKLLFPMTRIDRPLFERLKSLDRATLESRLGKLLVDGVNPLLRRRDAIVNHFVQLAAQKGEAEVFIP
jgi:hypothetical protein